jgi:hypothetical protein
MAWNKNLPDGGIDAAQLDNDVRTNNSAIESAIDLEHYFATGSTQHGRHKFGRGTQADRTALSNVADGMLYFVTDLVTGKIVPTIRDAAAWVSLTVYDALIARLDVKNQWTKPQYATWELITMSAGNLAVDYDKSPRQYANISANVTITNPVNDVAANGATIELDLTITGAGGWTVTWGNLYRSANSMKPVIAAVTGNKTKVFITGQQDGTYLVATQPNIGAF